MYVYLHVKKLINKSKRSLVIYRPESSRKRGCQRDASVHVSLVRQADARIINFAAEIERNIMPVRREIPQDPFIYRNC